MKDGTLQETKDLMALIYRNYLCDKETKNELEQDEIREIKKIEDKKIEQYKIEKFNKEKEELSSYDIIQNKKTTTDLTVKYENKWYKKFFKKIILFFRRKNDK